MNYQFLFLKKLYLFFAFFVLFSIILAPQSYAICEVTSFINQTTPSPQDRSCSSDDGYVITDITGDIYCSNDPFNPGDFEFKKITIENSNINFINCNFKYASGASEEIDISNSTIAGYGLKFESPSSIENNFISEFTNDSTNSYYGFENNLFDIYKGNDSTQVFAQGVDIKRGFSIQNTSSGNFTSISKFNTLKTIPDVIGSVDMYHVYVPFQSITNSSANNDFDKSYNIEFDFDSSIDSLNFSYSNFSSLDVIQEVQIPKNYPPTPLIAQYMYNPTTNYQEIEINFDEYVQSLNITILDSTNQEVFNYSGGGLKNISLENLPFDLNESEEYEVQFEYIDYFSNADLKSIILKSPSINNTEFEDEFSLNYIFNQSSTATLDATLQIEPTAISTPLSSLEFSSTSLSSPLFNITNSTQITFNSSSIFTIPTNSSFYQPHKGVISSSAFNSSPVVQLDNSSFAQSTRNRDGNFQYSISTPRNVFEILNNTKITPQFPEDIYFNKSFTLEALYLQTSDNSLISPSSCTIYYNTLTPTQTVQNMTFQPSLSTFNTSILFREFYPLQQPLTIQCSNELGLENVSNTFTINQTTQPIDNFTSDISYNPKSPGSFTTIEKELNISISSQGSQNINSNFDNEYSVMISRIEYLREGWNTSRNLTNWINIGKNEEARFSHSDLNYSKSIRLDLENSSTQQLNNSFIFRDIKDENGDAISLFVIVKSCVPPYSNEACEFFSNSSQFYIFQDSTPPLLYDFALRNMTNDDNFYIRINVDDLESDIEYANMRFSNAHNTSDSFSLPLTNYISEELGIQNAPLNSISSIEEGILYNLSINTSNNNNIANENLDIQNQLLLDNQPPSNSSLQLLDTSLYNTSHNRFYTNNGTQVKFNITSGFDNFIGYQNNSGISHYNLTLYSMSNDCSIRENQSNSISNNISDNQTQIITLNMTQDTCNELELVVFDNAGNQEVVDTLEIVVDTTPPTFNNVDGQLKISPIGSNSKFFNRDNLNKDSVLFSYQYDISDDLTPLKEITVNLYEKLNTTGASSNLVKQLNVSTDSKQIDFTLSNYSFKDNRKYKIGIVAENFAQLQTPQIESSEIFLGLTSSLNITPKGFLREDDNSFYYSPQFLNGANYPLEFNNNNQADVSCSLNTIIQNYSLSDTNQCSLSPDSSILSCQASQSDIEQYEYVIANCFISNVEEDVQEYFSKNISFTTLNQTSRADIDFQVIPNRTFFFDNETIGFNFTTKNDRDDATYLLEQTLNSPTNNISSMKFNQKGQNLTRDNLSNFNTSITPTASQSFFIFNNSYNKTSPVLNFTYNGLIPIYEFKFNNSINQSQINLLIENFLSENQNVEDKLTTNLTVNLTAPITNSFTLNTSNFNRKLDFDTSIIEHEFMIPNLNNNQLTFEALIDQSNKFEDIYLKNLSTYTSYLNYSTSNTFNFEFFDYFSFDNNVTFSFNSTDEPDELQLNSSQSFNLTLDPTQINKINLSKFIINNNTQIPSSLYSISTQISNTPSTLEYSLNNNSKNTVEEELMLYLNDGITNSEQTIDVVMSDNFGSSVSFELNLNWNLSQINSSSYDMSEFNTNISNFITKKQSSWYIDFGVEQNIISQISFEIENSTVEYPLNIDGKVNDSIYTLAFTKQIYDELHNKYFNEDVYEVDISTTYTTPFDIEFTVNDTIEFDFDVNENTISDRFDIDLDNNGINDLIQSIIYNKSLVFNIPTSNVEETFNLTNTSYFNISSDVFNSNIIISWNDNNSNVWDFSSTYVNIEEVEIENFNKVGSRMSIDKFPKFDSKKSIQVPKISQNSELQYCIGNNENLQTSSSCSGSDEYLVESCDSSIGGGIECVEESNSLTFTNLSFTTIETICSSCEESNDDSSDDSSGNDNDGSSGGGSSSGGSSSGGGGGSSGGGFVTQPDIEENKSDEDESQQDEENGSNNEPEEVEEVDENDTQTTEDSDNENNNNNEENQTTTSEENEQENAQDEVPTTPEEESSMSTILIAAVIILLLIVAIVGVYLYQQKKKKKRTSALSVKNYKQQSSLSNEKTQRPLTSLTLREREEFLTKIGPLIYKKTPLSVIAKKYNISTKKDIQELLNMIYVDTFIENIKRELEKKTFMLTPQIISELKNTKWFNSLNPCSDNSSYLRDLGFFISQYKITHVFNSNELKEIITDSIYEEISSQNEN
ncbi:MAG: hypothetical protein ACLFPL_01295 [Candidatus Nanoarchaeia archaeon]